MIKQKLICFFFVIVFFFSDDAVDPQPVLREITQVLFNNYSFHSVTIQVESQADQKPDCTLCEDPKI